MNSTRGSLMKSESFKINWIYVLLVIVVLGAVSLDMYVEKPTIKTGPQVEVILTQGEFFQVNEKVSMEAASTHDFILRNSSDNALLGALENPTDYFRMSHDDISGRWEVKQGSRVSVRFSGTPKLRVTCANSKENIIAMRIVIAFVTILLVCFLMFLEFGTY